MSLLRIHYLQTKLNRLNNLFCKITLNLELQKYPLVGILHINNSLLKMLETRIKEKILEIEKVADNFPSVIIVHNLVTQCVEYMSEKGLSILNVTLDELKAIGPEYFTKYFNPKEAPEYTSKFMNMVQENSDPERYTFFQQVRATKTDTWKWYLSASQVILTDKGKPILFLTTAQPIEVLTSLTNNVNNLLEDNQFYKDNFARFAALTKREKEVLKLLSEGKSNLELAEMLNLSVLTVETHRKKLKSKLGIKTQTDFYNFARIYK